MKKQKTIVFVDTENVGNTIPLVLPESIKVYYYLKDKNILPKIYPACFQKQVKIVDLATHSTHSKNEMDLALITQVCLSIQKHKQKRTYLILSNDKGYDYPIRLLKKNYGIDLHRICCSLEEYIEQMSEQNKSEKPAKEKIEAKEEWYEPSLFKMHPDFESYRQAQKPMHKRKYRKRGSFLTGTPNAWMEYDPYANRWVAFGNGQIIDSIPPQENRELLSGMLETWILEQSKKPKRKRRKKKTPEPVAPPEPL